MKKRLLGLPLIVCGAVFLFSMNNASAQQKKYAPCTGTDFSKGVNYNYTSCTQVYYCNDTDEELCTDCEGYVRDGVNTIQCQQNYSPAPGSGLDTSSGVVAEPCENQNWCGTYTPPPTEQISSK